MLSPSNLWVAAFYNFVAFWDLTYVTLVVPVLVAFDHNTVAGVPAIYGLEMASSTGEEGGDVVVAWAAALCGGDMHWEPE